MKSRILTICTALVVGVLPFATTSNVAHAFNVDIPGAGDFAIDIDMTQIMSSTMGLPPDMECTKTDPGDIAGASDTTSSVNGFGVWLYKANTGAAAPADGVVTADCDIQVSMAGQPAGITGTISNAANAINGTFQLQCAMQSTFKVNATIQFGKGVSHHFDLVVDSATQKVPASCSLRADFGNAGTLVGAVEALVKIGGSSCAGDQMTCVAFSITDAKVSITQGTGQLNGKTATGTYTIAGDFPLTKLEDYLRGQTQIGITGLSVSSKSVGKASTTTPASMALTFGTTPLKPVILRPVATKSGGTGVLSGASKATKAIEVVGKGGQTCTARLISIANLTRYYQFPSFQLKAATGRKSIAVTATQRAAALAKLGVKTGTTVKLKVTCGKKYDINKVVLKK